MPRRPYSYVAVLLLAPAVLTSARHTTSPREWQTQMPYAAGVVLLHWRHVYEGKDTVYRLEIKPSQGPSSVVAVRGQPVFDSKRTVVAFPYCADDGRDKNIELIDLTTRKRLAAVRLDYNGQFYFTCTWIENVLNVTVEHSFRNDGTPTITIHKF